jgi:type I restriction enzyme S subunit
MSGNAITRLTLEKINKLKFPLPPTLAEQEAIAEALNDADALIEAVEQLLTKKRQVKQGAMSELLTGKRRLSGFGGEWETKKLGEITEIISGGTPSTRIDEYWNGNINWCTPTDITGTSGKYLDSTEKQITELGLKNSSANLLPKGTLLLCTRATIGEVKIATDVICTNQGFKSLICSNQVNNEFLYYVLLTLKPKLIEKAIGSTFLEITKKQTALIEIRMPSIAEQTAIAEILSDMDAEISALEEKLVKARQVKAGMMSELLTGKIRLV